jgi:hypothetical protein
VRMARGTHQANTACQTGKAIALPCGMPGDLPLSGGLVSPFCSNMARRFLTALMTAILGQAPEEFL